MIWEMYPSELEELWRAFEEVNASFLGVVRMFRLDQMMIGMMQESVISSTFIDGKSLWIEKVSQLN